MPHPLCSLCLTPFNGTCCCFSGMVGRELLTDAQVIARLDELAARVDSFGSECDHMAEDGLSLVVFRAIAEGTCSDPQAAAHTMAGLLSTDRARWFA